MYCTLHHRHMEAQSLPLCRHYIYPPHSFDSSILKVVHSLLIYANSSSLHLMAQLHGCSSSNFTLNASISNDDARQGDKNVLWKPANISKDEKSEGKKRRKKEACRLFFSAQFQKKI